MFFSNTKYQLGAIDDESISFNIRRCNGNYLSFPRQVVIMPGGEKNSLTGNLLIVPGLIENQESDLLNELKETTKWKLVNRFSFKISSRMFSFLWRFKIPDESDNGRLFMMAGVEKKDEEKIQSIYKRYQEHLRHTLTPGQVYLIPDREVTFNQTRRKKKIYGRYVLLLCVNKDQVFFIPFTTRMNRMDKKKDIVFNSGFKGVPLSKEELPAVENFPYTIFKKETVLKVNALQKKEKGLFLDIALCSVGSVRKELVDFILAGV